MALIFISCVTYADSALWGNTEQQEFAESIRQKGLPSFAGDWKLVTSEGEACAPQIKVTQTGPVELSFAPAPGGIEIPAFVTGAINGGETTSTTWSVSARSTAVWNGPIIRQREIARGYFTVNRADRTILLNSDGTLSVSVIETATRSSRSYRCVYERPSSLATN